MAETFDMTREEYDTLAPRRQGYTTYMRAEWPGAQIPKRNPHPTGGRQAKQWDDGARAAYIDTLDCEEG